MAKNDDGLIGLDNIIKKIDAYAEGRITDFVMDLQSSLVAATPIEDPPTNTIVAKEHWKVAVDSYTMAGATGGPSYTGGVEIEMRAANTGRFLKAPGKGQSLPGFDIRKSQNIIVYNDVPYMARLNRGWSPQAAPFFIESTIDQVMTRWRLI